MIIILCLSGRLSKEDAEALRQELEEKDRQREDLILQVKVGRLISLIHLM